VHLLAEASINKKRSPYKQISLIFLSNAKKVKEALRLCTLFFFYDVKLQQKRCDID
jgi:hypothetical protein